MRQAPERETQDRARLLDAVLTEWTTPDRGRLGALQPRLKDVRGEAVEAAQAVSWRARPVGALLALQDHYVEMLVALQRVFGPAGEALLAELDLYPAQPEQAGDLIRFLYVQALLLTRPDPWPAVEFVYRAAAAGPLAEAEVLRRLCALKYGGEVPRFVGAAAAVVADPAREAWLRRVVPGVDIPALAVEREAALDTLAAQAREVLRRQPGVAGAVRARLWRDEGMVDQTAADQPPRPPRRGEVDAVLRHALAAETFLLAHKEWATEPVETLTRAALRGELSAAPVTLAHRLQDHVRRLRRWQERAELTGLDPQAPPPDDAPEGEERATIRTRIEEVTRVSERAAEDAQQETEAAIEFDGFLAAHPEWQEAATRVKADQRLYRLDRARFHQAFKAHVTGADGCPRPPA